MSMVAPAADPNAAAAAATATTSSKNDSILSEKVQRALHVRTDTPAMKAALEALCHLQRSSTDNKAIEATTVDAKSVRAAMEQDALHQALQLQAELSKLVSTVQALRQGISETADCAKRVKQAVCTNTIVNTSTTASTTAATAGAGEMAERSTSTDAITSSSAHEISAEEQLAATLAAAFARRDAAKRRCEAVQHFLDTYNLSQQDSRLLDHYQFEDVALVGVAALDAAPVLPANGMAFLKALTRVRAIRQALIQSLGGGSAAKAEWMYFQQQAQQEQEMASRSSSDLLLHEHHGLGASSALRMMETLAQKQERAYERLYHWLQRQLFHSSGNTTANDTELEEALQNIFIKQCLYTLRHVPAFYNHTLELIASHRRTEETKRFLLALTSGYAGQAPMEMKAHDAVAYVGDMLAFSFKAFSMEADVAQGIFAYRPDRDEQDEDNNDVESSNHHSDSEALSDDSFSAMAVAVDTPIGATDMVAISMSGLARPLKSRILHVVSTLARRPGDTNDDEGASDDGLLDHELEEEGAVVRTRITHLYEICGLLLFYASALEKSVQKLTVGNKQGSEAQSKASHDIGATLTEKNPLIQTLLESLAEATTGYEATVRVYAAMMDQLALSTGETEAHLANALLSVLTEVRSNSPGFSNDVSCPETCSQILSIDWASSTVVNAALTACKTLDDALVLEQSLDLCKDAGLGIIMLEKLYESIDEKKKTLITHLVEAETVNVLEACGLGSVATAWRQWSQVDAEGVLMVTFPCLAHDEVESSMREFYTSLFSPPLPSLESTVKDPLLRKKARSEIASKVCELYRHLHQSIVSERGGYDDTSFLNHTPEQVKTLFSV